MLISVIVSTYNRPNALALVLKALNEQTDKEFEVIVADDGSTKETTDLINQLKNEVSYNLIHAYQEDKGFRLSRVRNLGVKKSNGEYLIFLDGDCIPRKSFVASHRKLSQKNCLLCGNRILLSESFSYEVESKLEPIWNYTISKWMVLYERKAINRIHPLIVFPYFNKLRMLGKKWKKARGCNFSLYKENYLKVNGCDSDFTGWGYEDSDLAIRLIHSGVKLKSGRYATGTFHLYHNENDRSNQKENLEKLNNRITSNIIRAQNGYDELV